MVEIGLKLVRTNEQIYNMTYELLIGHKANLYCQDISLNIQA